jgi:hypothetical protein
MVMSEMTEMEIAAAAYTEYSRITGGKSLATGQPLPLWCDLPDNIRYAWHGTIYKVVCLVLNQEEIQTTYHDSILAENKKLNEALERIASDIPASRQNTPVSYLQGIAKAALEI